jgi:peptidoglycan hydrolase CwlO-like protein
MNKKLIASSAAILMTLVVGLAMLAIGGAALFNRNGVAASDTTSSVKVANVDASPQVQIQQLQALVTQYKAREAEYQQREQQYQTLLGQANAQIQQFQQELQQIQMLLQALQQRGLIVITSDGRILLNQ